MSGQLSTAELNRREWLAAVLLAAATAQQSGFACGCPDADASGSTRTASQPTATETSPQSATPATLGSLEHFDFLDEKQKKRSVDGRVLIEGADGSLLLQGIDSQIWRIGAERIQSRTAREQPFAPISKGDLATQLMAELRAGFTCVETPHYVLCSNASNAYSRWCGALLERLHVAFQAYWGQAERGLKTTVPEFPLVALIFEKQAEFAQFATSDAGPDTATVPGYYSILTNRIVLYDLAFETRRQRATSIAEVEQRVGAAAYNVATMIHEATHQIAFNCGLHTRLADNPVWLTEGMATYFETPDLKSKTGWKTAGQLNKNRLKRFKEFLNKRRAADSLMSLIRNDARLTDPETAEDAYAESWALTYFLIRKKAAPYVQFLQFLAAKRPLDYPTPEQRIAEFVAIFGDLKRLDGEFVRYLRSLN